MRNLVKALPCIRGNAILAVCILALATLVYASSGWAATLSVTNLNDSGPGSLRQAIADALPGDTITFSVYGTITLTSGALTIGKSLDIEGPGANMLKISGNHASRVFVVLPNTTVTLARVTISDGLADLNSPFIPSIGGGILNSPGGINPATTLILSEVVVSDSRALGHASRSPLTPGLPGAGFGGGVANFGTLAVDASSFIDNLARGGDGSTPRPGDRPIAGLGGGGGIANFGSLTVTGSRFSFNQGIGGSNCASQFLSGHGIAGAISSGSAVATLIVSDSVFDHNRAIGGNGNISPVPATIGPDKASGGAIDVTGGTATIDGCTFKHNWSIGGSGASGADGGIGSAGAVMATNFNGLNTNVTIRNSKVEHNIALGGPGSAGRDGGEGSGGGLVSTAAGILTVINTMVEHNHAQGGPGGEGGNGGNGLGGGLYDNSDSPGPTSPPPGPTVLVLQSAMVTKNLALGGEVGNGGSEGQGIGGGVYYLGTYSADSETVIKKNQATTSNDNVGP